MNWSTVSPVARQVSKVQRRLAMLSRPVFAYCIQRIATPSAASILCPTSLASPPRAVAAGSVWSGDALTPCRRLLLTSQRQKDDGRCCTLVFSCVTDYGSLGQCSLALSNSSAAGSLSVHSKCWGPVCPHSLAEANV